MTTTDTDIKPLTRFQSLVRVVEFLADKPLLQEKMSLHAIYFFANNEDEWKAILDEMGTFTKGSDDYSLNAVHTIGTTRLNASIGHEGICEKVLVGTKDVEVSSYPDDVQPTVTTESVDVYEWVCPESWKA